MGHLPCISKENELAAWEHINNVIDHALSKYPTTLEQDVMILQSD